MFAVKGKQAANECDLGKIYVQKTVEVGEVLNTFKSQGPVSLGGNSIIV